MSNIFFTSDLHFYHNRDFVWAARGFSSVDEMNEILVENYNKIVKSSDICYILGDCYLNCTDEQGIEMLERLNGNKQLIIGNHDTDKKLDAMEQAGVFQSVRFAAGLKLSKHKYAYMSHFPTMTGNGKDAHIISLYGHTHQKLPKMENSSIVGYNVGVDAWNNRPVAIEEIKELLRHENESY